jgi:hypothetical protein
MALTRYPEAIRILEEWLEIDPTNSEAQAFHFAASQPDRFPEIMDKIHRAQMQAFGIPMPPKGDGPDNSDAVREMIVSSGAVAETMDVSASFGAQRKIGEFDAESFELETDCGCSGLVFHPNRSY